MFARLGVLLAILLIGCAPAWAGAISEAFIDSAAQSLAAAPAAESRIHVSMWVIAFYLFYLGVIWAFNFMMLRQLGRRDFDVNWSAKSVCFANVLLASGDTAMFIAFLIAYLFPGSFSTTVDAAKLMQLLLLGVFSTSVTMSVYYLFIGIYMWKRFAGAVVNLLFSIVVSFFVLRLLVHYNPGNIWFSMSLPSGTPNYSAWLRNIPLFIYGLLSVSVIAYLSIVKYNDSEHIIVKKYNLAIILAMISLVLSFIFYAVDVFYSHLIPREYIWIVYVLKTLAYMLALVCMWLGEFYYGRQIPLAKATMGEV
ncbi:hypothetical protein [Ensifer aridi]|uniref:hypothetical protein n=1 Tax=Ensifer aridi TaxID=1708715 RepID=UPI000A113192|nr:hypothetical protein [Ensifer aridi]